MARTKQTTRLKQPPTRSEVEAAYVRAKIESNATVPKRYEEILSEPWEDVSDDECDLQQLEMEIEATEKKLLNMKAKRQKLISLHTLSRIPSPSYSPVSPTFSPSSPSYSTGA